jgi:hypothetical protein
MLPKDKGGVVDPRLKVMPSTRVPSVCADSGQVYGTTNLRVVDLSIVPLHFAAHPVGEFLNGPDDGSNADATCSERVRHRGAGSRYH